MSEKEVNTISHLLEVEQRASELTTQAQLDADKLIASAKAKSDSEFQAKYNQIIDDCEKSYKIKSDELQKKHEKEFSDYKTNISSSAQDFSSFTSYLDSILLA